MTTYYRSSSERTDTHHVSCNTVGRISAQDLSLRSIAHPSSLSRTVAPHRPIGRADFRPEVRTHAMSIEMPLSTDNSAQTLTHTIEPGPQIQGISSRRLSRARPWVQVAGTYRVNRRLTHTVGNGKVEFVVDEPGARAIPQELRELPPVRDTDDDQFLRPLAENFVQYDLDPGTCVAEFGEPMDRVISSSVANSPGSASVNTASPPNSACFPAATKVAR
ncbi:MAG: hypothetical protein H5T78_11545 [Nocardia sp.]|nr:hypothetical protein [Nocardia sp.]